MRIIIIAAAAAACLSGAAWAGANHGAPKSSACETEYLSEAEADQISATIEAALEQALAGLERARLDDATQAHVEAAIERAMVEVETELGGGRLARGMTEAEEEALEARIEAAMERVEEAMERVEERIEAAVEARERAEPKIWRPRY